MQSANRAPDLISVLISSDELPKGEGKPGPDQQERELAEVGVSIEDVLLAARRLVSSQVQRTCLNTPSSR